MGFAICILTFSTSPSRSLLRADDAFRRTGMNWDQVQGNWEQFKGKVRQKWGKLTDNDLQRVKGMRQELAGRIQERYGYEKDKAEKEIDEFVQTCDSCK
jgi:uncharacterized protein YjbJ (UPF0337 family)